MKNDDQIDALGQAIANGFAQGQRAHATYLNDHVTVYLRRRRTSLHALHAPFVDFIRASGDARCRVCDVEYRRHSMDPKIVSWDDSYWLHVLCDGTHVKL